MFTLVLIFGKFGRVDNPINDESSEGEEKRRLCAIAAIGVQASIVMAPHITSTEVALRTSKGGNFTW
jgi:hypothetical protein